MNPVLFSSEREDWETPNDFFKALDAEFRFTLDAAASRENHKCPKYFTAEENALLQNWGGRNRLAQPALRAQYRRVGKESLRRIAKARNYSCNACPQPNGYCMVPRLHFRKGKNSVCSRPIEIWKEQE